MFQSFSKIWIIVAVAVFAFAGIFCWQYFGTQKEIETSQEKATETEKLEEQIENHVEIVEAEIADWKTYRNEEYGFEIKYFSEWDLSEAVKPYDAKEILFQASFQTRRPYEVFVIRIRPNPEDFSIEEFYEEDAREIFTRSGLKIGLKFEKIVIGEDQISTTKVIKTLGYVGELKSPEATVIVPIRKIEYVIEIEDSYGLSLSDSGIEKIFNQMLSSFRFLE